LQFVVFSPQVERARAPLFSLSLGRKLLQIVVSILRLREQELLCHLLVCQEAFAICGFFSSGWQSKWSFAISLFAC
jgi:hypothetical protein